MDARLRLNEASAELAEAMELLDRVRRFMTRRQEDAEEMIERLSTRLDELERLIEKWKYEDEDE